MALKPVTFKIDEGDLVVLEREARASKKPRSEYVRDIVLKRHDSKPRRPNRGDKE